MIKYRTFKISLNISLIHVYSDSRVWAIKNPFVHVILSIWYSLICFLFGWWGFGILYLRRNGEAFHINITGGIDCSKEIGKTEYDDQTNYLWNNLRRETTQNLDKELIEIISEIQQEFEKSNKVPFKHENRAYTLRELSKIGVYDITEEVVHNLFDAMKMYRKSGKSV